MRRRSLLVKVKWFHLQVLFIVFSLLSANASFSQAITWTGGPLPSDTFADNPASWSGGVLPTATSDVIIPDGSFPLFVDVSTTWASITFSGGTQSTRVSIGPGVTGTVTGNITFNAASASRNLSLFGPLSCAAIVGATNTSASGNVITIVSGGGLTVPGDATGFNLQMIGTSVATFGGNLTGGTVDAGIGNSSTVTFNSTDAQTFAAGTYAKIIFSGGGTKTLAGPITITSSATFTSGIVINSSASKIFFDGTNGGQPTVSGASATSFATGPVEWKRIVTTGSFTFPVGKQGAGYHPVILNPVLSPTDFTAEYIRSSGRALGPITAAGILKVSSCEYWTVTRTAGTGADITLTWDATSGCGGTYIADLPTVRAVHFNGTNWDLAGITGGTGTVTAGSVSWLGVANFSPFTIGTTSLLNPLPVSLTDFSASRCGSSICLFWKTASENNNDHFEVDRSADGTQFNSIGNVNGSGTTSDAHSYTFQDDHPLDGKNYYRIKQVDIDGRFSYSSIIRINNAGVTAFNASITPNPATTVMNLVIEGVTEKENLAFEMLNTSGMVVYRESISAGGTTMVKSLPRPAVSAGLYFYKIKRSSTNETFSGRLVLQ